MEGRPPEEEDLVARAQRGDVDAYEQLVRAYQRIAFRTAFLLSGNASDAEEAAQDGFVKAYRALARFRRGSPFRPWLLQIVANEAHNRRRSAGRRENLVLRTAAESRPGDAAPSPEAAFLATEGRATLLEAVNGLREEERDVIVLRFFLELSEAETAAALGIPAGTAKSRLARGLERLRAQMEAVDA